MAYKTSKISGKLYKFPELLEITFDTSNANYLEFEIWSQTNQLELFEGTQEEIELKYKEKFVQQFRELRVSTARAFMQKFSDEVTIFLIGKPSALVDEIDEQLIGTVHKIFAFLNSRNADYWTARREINAMTPPINSDALNFFNQAKTHINEFVTVNYPTEEL